MIRLSALAQNVGSTRVVAVLLVCGLLVRK